MHLKSPGMAEMSARDFFVGMRRKQRFPAYI